MSKNNRKRTSMNTLKDTTEKEKNQDQKVLEMINNLTEEQRDYVLYLISLFTKKGTPH